MIVTIRRVDPQTGRDVCSTATLRGACISGETEPVYDATDAALMKRVDARYADVAMPHGHEGCIKWMMRRHDCDMSRAKDIVYRRVVNSESGAISRCKTPRPTRPAKS